MALGTKVVRVAWADRPALMKSPAGVIHFRDLDRWGKTGYLDRSMCGGKFRIGWVSITGAGYLAVNCGICKRYVSGSATQTATRGFQQLQRIYREHTDAFEVFHVLLTEGRLGLPDRHANDSIIGGLLGFTPHGCG